MTLSSESQKFIVVSKGGIFLDSRLAFVIVMVTQGRVLSAGEGLSLF